MSNDVIEDEVDIEIDEADDALLADAWLAEALVDGDEYSCDFLVHGDSVEVLRLVRKFAAPDFGFFRGFHLFGPEEFARWPWRGELQRLCAGAALALEAGTPALMYGPSHIDWAHTVGEHVSIDDLVHCAQGIALAGWRLCS